MMSELSSRTEEPTDRSETTNPDAVSNPARQQRHTHLIIPKRSSLTTDPSVPDAATESTQHDSGVPRAPASEMTVQPLPFFQRYFTKPVIPTKDAEKHEFEPRRFSLFSVGSLILGSILLLLLGGIVAAAALTTIDQHKAHAREQQANIPIRMAIPSNFPDPSLLYDSGTWYAFGTNNAAGVLPDPGTQTSSATQDTPEFGIANIQMATSRDFVNWTVGPLGDQPLPETGAWSQIQVNDTLVQPKISNTWAPAVIQRSDGKYVMYYTSARGGPNPYATANVSADPHPVPHCIGVAVSNTSSPAGPYTPSDEALVCPWQQGGAIDPEVILDNDGTLYLVYKIDGNNIGHGGSCGNTEGDILPTPIMLQKLDSTGTQLVGDPVQILTNGPDDGPLVEAPMLIRSQDGIYFLFFSSGCTRAPSYDVQYATATSITGPYTRQPIPLLKTGSWGLVAPGSIGISEFGNGGWRMVFHARTKYEDVGLVRAMYVTQLQLSGTKAIMIAHDDVVHLQRS